EQPAVLDVLAGCAREQRVDLRRATVRDRVADDRVAIAHDRRPLAARVSPGEALPRAFASSPYSASSGLSLSTVVVASAPLVKVQVRTICRMSPSRAICSVN